MGVVMQTLKQSFEERNLTMAKHAANLAQYWQKRLAAECPEQSEAARESIILWLLGVDLNRFDLLNPQELEIAKQAMEYRWRILHQRYLGIGRERAYRNLISRLGSLVTLRNKIQTWVSLSRDRQRSVMDVLQEVIQELLQSDNYMQQQMACIAGIATDRRLQDTLLFASIEEYCLRPVRNQPLLVYRFVNYLRRTQRGGLTQVPGSDSIRLVSEEFLTEDSENRINLVDSQAIAEYQEAQKLEEQQALRQVVHQQLEKYLRQNLGQEAVEWLGLYLQGKSQEEIGKKLNKPIKEIYRLREKISYHAVRVFALKGKPELVDNWLSISLQEHNLGLTQNKWQQLDQQLTPMGRQILNLRRAGNSIEATAQQLKLKTHQVLGEWTKIYLTAQALRTED
ncbi:HetZ-related protein 2 [Cylindrospermum sp. FACHB-282]|uniref:HetZ-related protein 2 n=1 Tax=Cylindrospermum sp. FACHB-282 TaxID=2692794 RepID=UPI00168A3ABA|nr:HetZ-related protein 2 [Cylindrospermum sp. FACHB-282]MBD2388659.1 HetZ-related protein 2 [Cylindrospermum sp. FACHB-282]